MKEKDNPLHTYQHGDINEYSYEKILKEPAILKEKKTNIENEMKSLALDNYKLFIQNYTTINNTNKNINVISNEIVSLLDHLPEISNSCEKFSKESHNLSDNRKSVKNLLDNFPTLLDLLEIPQLMDTCVKSAYYEEALQLEAFAKKLVKQFPSVKIVDVIMNEIQEIRLSLISNLQQFLSGNTSLTDCIKTIGYLRKLSMYKENELKILFLYCREQWFMNQLKSINDSNMPSYLTKLTDNCRTNIFDVITQFTAIFSNEAEDENNLDDMILYSWVQHKVNLYISNLEMNLALIKEGTSIHYILENSMYFSMSLSRVGIDFRGLLQPIFEKQIFNNFQSQLTVSTHHFLESLKSYKFPQPKVTSSSNSSSSNSSSFISPPMNLLGHPPLAILMNSFLKSFNELKECLPLSLKDQITLKLKDILITIISGVQSFYNQSSFTITQDQVFLGFCRMLVDDFLPFIVRCFNLICNINTDGGDQTSQIDLKPLTWPLLKIYSDSTLTLDDYDTSSNNSPNNIHSPPITSSNVSNQNNENTEEITPQHEKQLNVEQPNDENGNQQITNNGVHKDGEQQQDNQPGTIAHDVEKDDQHITNNEAHKEDEEQSTQEQDNNQSQTKDDSQEVEPIENGNVETSEEILKPEDNTNQKSQLEQNDQEYIKNQVLEDNENIVDTESTQNIQEAKQTKELNQTNINNDNDPVNDENNKEENESF
ncbi:oligomeric Golgi complex component [Tieghemostelium lacteum]|uniref:Conserved oligomeric Golgi complex subunit 8 n=1 Tax=Tieghemostelium lacteum TaxID=361077 RepID=A0A152A723_TIELA|nr:oligomeric Golgi complex component [Tieghemostelium lacteum]|eukprot:KYR02016.1 oligomeric Golgi complex component [Tieghemostelium lacteum]